ncbi:phosphorylase superfamily protein [Colletotrichum tofieldiae]|nr:phosphorylase superfamily protein [Colletotrichum tofieldiae]
MAVICPARDFTVGWVCALPIELAAAAEMMDEEFADLPSQPADTNIYSFGRIGVHNVVAACLPAGQMGTNQAATVASQMRTSFPSLRFGVLVGIGGGVPNLDDDIDIRLGDIVISQPSGSMVE